MFFLAGILIELVIFCVMIALMLAAAALSHILVVDSIIITIIADVLLYINFGSKIHMVFYILITVGLLTAICAIAKLTTVGFWIISGPMIYCVTLLVYEIILEKTKGDFIWGVFGAVLTDAILLGLHFFDKYKEDYVSPGYQGSVPLPPDDGNIGYDEYNRIFSEEVNRRAAETLHSYHDSVNNSANEGETASDTDTRSGRTGQQETGAEDAFFSGCDTPESIDERYRTLMKMYHPDNKNGSEETAKKISETYAKIKARQSSNT